jgi:hypothetical protein
VLELLHTHLGFIFPKVFICLLVIISLFFFFVSKKVILSLVPAMAEHRFQKYKMRLAVVTGLPQQRGNQSSQLPSHQS